MTPIRRWMLEVFSVAIQDTASRGFSITKLRATRKRADLTVSLDLQPDKRNQEDFGHFFVNVSIEVLSGNRFRWGTRLENLVRNVPHRWELRTSTDRAEVGDRLRQCLVPVLDMFDRVTELRDQNRQTDELIIQIMVEVQTLLRAATGTTE